MKITICGSAGREPSMNRVAEKAVSLWHEIVAKNLVSTNLLPSELRPKKTYSELLREHFENVRKSDAILVLNLGNAWDKDGISMEMMMEIGFAAALRKNIFVLNEFPYYAKAVLWELNAVSLLGDVSGLKGYDE